MYADYVSEAMEQVIAKTRRRREAQMAYNKKHGITLVTGRKAIANILVHHTEEASGAVSASVEVRKSPVTRYPA
jgi:excinuclease ABC subunit B